MNRLFPPIGHFSIPNLMTTGSIVLGFVTLWLVAEGHVAAAAVVYLGVLISDRLDGVVARRLRQTSEFGKQLDSLADLLNFCALPAIASYVLGLRAPWQIVLAGTYVVAGVWRLAYYNVNELEDVGGRLCFVGLCTTNAAALLLGTACLVVSLHLNAAGWVPVATGALAVVMVSGLRIPKTGPFTYALMVGTPIAVGVAIFIAG